MVEVRLSPQAERDLEEILTDLDRKSTAAADRYAAAFDEKGRTLARFPEMGRSRSEINPTLRSTLVAPYVLFYRLEGDVVQVLRILHGRRDVRSIMKEEPEN